MEVGNQEEFGAAGSITDCYGENASDSSGISVFSALYSGHDKYLERFKPRAVPPAKFRASMDRLLALLMKIISIYTLQFLHSSIASKSINPYPPQ